MGKGPIGFVIPITIITIDLLYNGKIKYIWDRRMFLGVLACLLCLIPMSYGLYTQFGFEGVEFFIGPKVLEELLVRAVGAMLQALYIF